MYVNILLTNQMSGKIAFLFRQDETNGKVNGSPLSKFHKHVWQTKNFKIEIHGNKSIYNKYIDLVSDIKAVIEARHSHTLVMDALIHLVCPQTFNFFSSEDLTNPPPTPFVRSHVPRLIFSFVRSTIFWENRTSAERRLLCTTLKTNAVHASNWPCVVRSRPKILSRKPQISFKLVLMKCNPHFLIFSTSPTCFRWPQYTLDNLVYICLLASLDSRSDLTRPCVSSPGVSPRSRSRGVLGLMQRRSLHLTSLPSIPARLFRRMQRRLEMGQNIHATLQQQ